MRQTAWHKAPVMLFEDRRKKKKQWEERAWTSRSGGQSFDNEEVLLKAGPGELPQEVVKSLSLEIFKKYIAVALTDVVYWA